jgi:hypothetical protein
MRSSRSFLTVVAAGGLAAALAACGSSSPTQVAAVKRDAMVTFAKCMRANGVPSFPDPGTNGNGGIRIQQRVGSGGSLAVNGVAVSSPSFQSAMSACRSKLPNGGRPPALSATQRAAMLRFSQCIRTHGVPNFPDPTFGAGGRVGIGFGPGSGIDPRSPSFQQAQAACAKLRGGAPFAVKVP